MKKDETFWELQRTLTAEFSKYVLAHQEIEGRIPDGAQIVFQLTDNPEFNAWALKIAKSQCKPGQPMIVVKIRGLAPIAPSRLISPKLVSV